MAENKVTRLAPNATIGIIGGGQLGRMLAMAAARLSYRTIILESDPDCPAGQVANRQIVAAYDDPEALAQLVAECDVVTYEFENIPVSAAKAIAQGVGIYPPAAALEVSQDRVSEKQFLNGTGIETAEFLAVDNDADLAKALASFGGEGILKTRRMGYDGKGQKLFRKADQQSVDGTYQEMGSVPLVLEALVPFEREISIIAGRGQDGETAIFEPAWNVHRNGILHTSTIPSGVGAATIESAKEIAARIMQALNYVGVIGVEFFVLPDGSLKVNEIAPRVHNSGHWTEAACALSQFELHIRCIAGLPLGSTRHHSDCVMENLIGDDVERVGDLLAQEDVLVHLYGKKEVRAGRKMGHFTQLTRSNWD